jgi:2-polyprenyl-6-methoxyphenol hydroxylase-like FAD-dependent oxidoreductase
MTTAREVVVVGAGPTGVLLAGDLAAAGIPVTVLEKRAEGVSNLSRAFGVHARTLELLDARDLADELVATGQIIHELRLFGTIPFDISRLASRYPFLLVTPQYEVEKLLLRRAIDNGVVFQYGTEVSGLAQDEAGVVVSAKRGADTTTWRAAYVVGADGSRSAVRTALGLPFPGRAVIKSVVLADVRLSEEPAITVRVHGTGNAFGFIAPFGDGYWRIGGWDRTSREVDEHTPVELEELRSITERAFGTDFGMHDPRWLGRFHSDERQVPSYRLGRVLLAGDAAHQHSPAGGQGMNTGLQDAANLSWKLAAVLKGWSRPELLDSYHQERHPIGASVLRSSGLNLRLAMAHNPIEVTVRAIRQWVVRHVGAVSRQAIDELTGIGYGYPAARKAHRQTGRRMPDADLKTGRLYEVLRAGQFVLITAGGVDESGRADRLVRTQWTDGRTDAVLVRPDGYVAWTAEEPDQAGIEAALTAWLGPMAS